MSTRPPIADFQIIDGCLGVGGISVQRLAERAGGTPFFAYDRDKLAARIGRLRSALPVGLNISYAIKANPMPAIVQYLAGLVDAFDVASAFEMRTALDTPMPASRVSFAGPGKTTVELRQAVAAGVTIEIESEGEAERLGRIGSQLGIRPTVAIRANPNFQIRGSGMRMGGGSQQFGIDSERIPSLVAGISQADLELIGFHVFAGSQLLHVDLLCEAQRKTVELVLSLAENAQFPIKYINLGGGFGIPYFEKDEPIDLERVGENLADLITTRIKPSLPPCRIVIELGRYIVGECGVYVTRVVDRKESRGQTYLVVDGGLHHQLGASGNFGQVIRRNYPLVVGNKVSDSPCETVTIVGCLCTPLDLLGSSVTLPRAEVEDLIVIFQAGAYGLTASPGAFLGHPPAVEILV